MTPTRANINSYLFLLISDSEDRVGLSIFVEIHQEPCSTFGRNLILGKNPSALPVSLDGHLKYF